MKNYFMHKINNLLTIKKIVTIHYQEINEDYLFSGEKHPFWEMAYVDQNKVIYQIDDKKIEVKEKEIIFIRPNVFHSLSCQKDTKIFIMSFECLSPCMSYFMDKKLGLENESIFLLSKIINEAKSTFYLPPFDPSLHKMQLLQEPFIGGEQMIKNYLEIFLINLLRIEAKRPSSDIVFYSKSDEQLGFEEAIVRFLKKSLYQKITLDDICKEAKCCKTYVCTNFKKQMNQSVMNYYMKLKIQEAKKLIKGNKSFKEISFLLHFDTPSHFTNTFKQHTKMTPRQYKNSIMK